MNLRAGDRIRIRLSERSDRDLSGLRAEAFAAEAGSLRSELASEAGIMPQRMVGKSEPELARASGLEVVDLD